ncbi:response regulator [Paenibacillus mendelii]|uniref:Response regulator n=1 Tax=Paenibacillus mendelii TaxID=206163 RepID=A0ABV6J1W0_9BACL|nr:response regulator [Paenibacillus mendelii]MCQ6562792.1 response regulator [Paenibacillus mendelii]
MYRILIVDDEPIIVNSLYQLLQESSHLEVEVYRAFNVYEALDCLKQIRMDIVITDIRMPGMSGIELHQQIIQSWPRCRVIFLTGYNDFDYARQAIRSGGVVDYVLKNEDDHIILAAVEKAITELDQVEDGADYMHQAKKKLQLAIPAMQKNTLFDLMREQSLTPKERVKRFIEAEIPLLPDKGVLLVTGRMDGWKEGANDVDRTLLIYACQNIAEEYLAPSVVSVSVVYESTKLVWFMQPKELLDEGQDEEQENRAWQHMKTRVYGIMEAVQQSCRQLMKISISLVMGRESIEWNHIGAQFHYLKALLGHGANSGHELLIQDTDRFGLHSEQGHHHDLHKSQQINKQLELLEQYMSSGQRDAYLKLYNDIMNPDELPGYKFQLELFYAASLHLISYAIRMGLFHELFLKMDLGKTTQYDVHESWLDASAYLARVADYLLAQYEPVPEEQSDRLIHTIHHYIQDHLDGDLSLTMLSTVVHHSPTYLSRLYKRVTGSMLSDYITEERMKRAKKQLTETSMKIQEIASLVGYEAAPQFNRIFKKMFKMTPQAYREWFLAAHEMNNATDVKESKNGK